MKTFVLSAVPLLAALLTSCAPSGPSYRVYISNEGSGDLTIIDPQKMEATATIPIGKRARGIHASADGKQIFLALSGSPFAPPGVDESTLPPPDKSADGIGIYDVAANKLLRKVPGGSDPEQFAVGKDGLLYVSNEDAAGLSFVDPVKGDVLATVSTGAEPEGVTLTPDAKFVYVTSEDKGTITVVDTATRKAVKTIQVGRRPRGIVFLPDGSRAFVTNENDATLSVIDTAKLEVVQTIQIGAGTEADGYGHGARRFQALRHNRARQKSRGGGTGHRQYRNLVRGRRPPLGHRSFTGRKAAVHRQRTIQRRLRRRCGDAQCDQENQGRREALGRFGGGQVTTASTAGR